MLYHNKPPLDLFMKQNKYFLVWYGVVLWRNVVMPNFTLLFKTSIESFQMRKCMSSSLLNGTK